MKVWATYFTGLGLFGVAVGTFYWIWTYEFAGSVLLWSFASMPLVVVAWAWTRGLLAGADPSDDPDAEIAGRTGESVGVFPEGSAWPPIIVIGLMVTGAAIVYGAILLTVGLALTTWAIVGLTRESSR